METEIYVFTDGSKLDNNGTGSGYIIKCKDKHYTHQQSTYLGTTPKVFQAELNAILEAASHLNKIKTSNKNITFFSDSKSSIETLSKTRHKGKLEQEVQQELNALGIYNNVYIKWIKAHTGLRGNEIADRLAKRGAENLREEQIIEPRLPRNGGQNKDKIKEWGEKKQLDNWKKLELEQKARITRIFFPKPWTRKAEKFWNL